jgi:hypothetical protein
MSCVALQHFASALHSMCNDSHVRLFAAWNFHNLHRAALQSIGFNSVISQAHCDNALASMKMSICLLQMQPDMLAGWSWQEVGATC